MSSHYAKPENALRKASDLLSIRKPKAALRTLDVILTSKRHRQWQPTHEQIMIMYLDLAVNQRQNVKDALVQYRLICQAAQAQSLEKILRHYIQLSQQKVAKIQNRSGVNIQAIEDLDETTPDDLIAAAFSGKVSHTYTSIMHAYSRHTCQLMELVTNRRRCMLCYPLG